VAATTQEEVLAGILPKINIDKITLTNPSEDILNVSLNLTIKEVLDDNLFGSWFEDININKYIVVDVVQSTDASVTEALSYSNDMIQVCNLQRQLKIEDTRTKAVAYITKNTKVSDLLKLLADKLSIEDNSENPMERGHTLEQEAIDKFTEMTGKKVVRTGMWVSDENENIACSPDGMISDTEAVEIKCLSASRHLEAFFTKDEFNSIRIPTLGYNFQACRLQTKFRIPFDSEQASR
jgi:hypothetical protein